MLGAGGLTELVVGAVPTAGVVPDGAGVALAAAALLLRTRVPTAAFGLAALVVVSTEVPGGPGLTASMVLGLMVALSSVAQRCAPPSASSRPRARSACSAR